MVLWKYDGFSTVRRPTRTVQVGSVPVGSDHPISVQSMTTTQTGDTTGTVEQICRLTEAGCDIVRLTVPTSGDVQNLAAIRQALKQRRIEVPLVADVHFTPAVAIKVVEHVEKIRINPGNFADKKKFAVHEYTDAAYALELERIAEQFTPLVKRTRELGVSMRIGVNHGSLSDRIMNRFGDTPDGMVESAFEFVKICESLDYHSLILSMKSSNPVIVHHVYRLLAERMGQEGMDYPIHLGVTEAGSGEDGRVKSAIGIGALLLEGIGDTIRVSLTEDPVAEIPVARALIAGRDRLADRPHRPATSVSEQRDPFSHHRRPTRETTIGSLTVGGSQPVRVELPLSQAVGDTEGVLAALAQIAATTSTQKSPVELIAITLRSATELPQLEALQRALSGPALSAAIDIDWLLNADDASLARWLTAVDRLHLTLSGSPDEQQRQLFARLPDTLSATGCAILIEAPADVLIEATGLFSLAWQKRLLLAVTASPDVSPLGATRLLAARLDAAALDQPIVLIDRPEERGDDPQVASAVSLGGLLCDGIGDALQVSMASTHDAHGLAYTILQGSRVRMTRTELISCPSCGRTQFELEETTQRIKALTAHLDGLKIAVMGCVVNGPGEMADADFGYVGWGKERVALFVGQQMVSRDIPANEAPEKLVELLKEHGCWVEPA
jgi:(E)-4-hydroxy-3-methylbut-2-enyl-diphosphate synthase